MRENSVATPSTNSRVHGRNDNTTPSSHDLDVTTPRYVGTTNAAVNETKTRHHVTAASSNDLTSTPGRDVISKRTTKTISNSQRENMTTYSTRFTNVRSSSEETTRLETSTAPTFTTGDGTTNSTIILSTTEPMPHEICFSKTTLFIVSGVSGGIVLVVAVLSLICCLCLRHKWHTKLSLERERTDIWSMRTYNNTIINDNFMDYQLASTTTFPTHKSSLKNHRKSSSGLSEHSVRIIDPYSRRSSRNNSSAENITELRRGSSGKRRSYDQQYSFDDSTLRRNTYSAPGGLDAPIVTIATKQNMDTMPSNRERALTYSAGKKHKVDRHVLLTHEEFVEDDAIQEYGGSMPNNSYFVTEL